MFFFFFFFFFYICPSTCRLHRGPLGRPCPLVGVHPLMSNPIVLSGKDSKDAQPYQEKDIMKALKELEKRDD